MRLIAIVALAALAAGPLAMLAGCAGGNEGDMEANAGQPQPPQEGQPAQGPPPTAGQGAGQPADPPAPSAIAPPDAVERTLPPQTQVARASNRLGLALYERLRQEPGNVFFSPLSISVALGMAYAGAEGETAVQMRNAMRLATAEPAPVHEGFGALIRSLTQPREDGPVLRLANRAWVQQGFELRESYLALVGQQYGAAPGQVDFQGAAAQAADSINAWVSDRTEGKIPQLVSAGGFDEMTRLILTNAIYLRARWQHEFRPEQTEPQPFRGPAGERQVPTMRRRAAFPYFETPEFQLLVMPYDGAGLQMAVLLPRADDGLPALEGSLEEARLREWLSAAEARPVDVYLPTFTERLKASLADHLEALGMPQAFTPGAADFGGMSEEDLFIQAVLHEAYVKVDEKGTEAAAATSVQMGVTSAPPGLAREPIVFRADHPFVFFIRDGQSQAVLFMGRVEEPKTGE